MRKWYAPVILALAFVVSAAVYSSLPGRIPVHWNLAGDVDRWGSRLEAAFFLPFGALLLWLVLRALPRIDPRRENYARFQGTYDLIVNGVVTLLVVIHLLVLGNALGLPVPLARALPMLVGVMLIVLGNVLPRARPNWWFGIRTPWTLSNDRVWERTHRVGGYVLVAAGIVSVVVTAFWSSPASRLVLLGTILGAAFGCFVYSYFAWRQETSK